MLPPLAEVLSSLRVVSLPMRVRFRGITVREAALCEGPAGWTEFSAFPEYDDAEAATWLSGALEYGWGDLPAHRRTEVPVNATVPAVAATEVRRVLALWGVEQPHTVKVKVAEPGQVLADDVARVAAVQAAAPSARIRVDANGAWSVDEAKRAMEAFADFRLEYVEQPVASIDEMAAVREWSQTAGPGTYVAADESVRKATDPLRVAREGAADVLVVKAQPLGGVNRALQIVEAAGLPAVVSSALDTTVGIGMGFALAAALPQLPYACGLGTGGFFARDIGTEPRTGWRQHPSRARVDVEAMAALAATPDRAAWWRARVERCYALLASGASAG